MRLTRRSAAVIAALAATVSLAAAVPSGASGGGASVVAFAHNEVAYYGKQVPPGVAENCLRPAGRPTPGSAAWRERDLLNQYCATLRLRDQVDSPAFLTANALEGNSLYLAQLEQQLGEPGHLHGGITTLVPGALTADPWRTLKRWTAAGRGRATSVKFRSLDGAQLRGFVFEPPASAGRPAAGYPGVVITDGSIQGYQELYFWAAEGLAEAGYMVMTYDPQGQGNSDLLPAKCRPSAAQLRSGSLCQGVPYQQNYNFFQGAEDSLSFFLSTPDKPYGGSHNPWYAGLNAGDVGIAGHSLGAAGVTEVGQCDRRVKTIVAWDNLGQATFPCKDSVTVPAAYQSTLHAPALGLNNDYFFNPQPMSSPPDPHAKDAGFQQLTSAGLDSMIVSLRGATHLTYTYVPYVLPASELGERFAFYYTLAWFDRYLRGDSAGFNRLIATRYDTSADVHSIGAGIYSAAKASAHPTDPYAGNVPYTIDGIPVANSVSFYYESEYSLTGPSGGRVMCSDLRAGCPVNPPPTP
jgi:hypothetical protein